MSRWGPARFSVFTGAFYWLTSRQQLPSLVQCSIQRARTSLQHIRSLAA
jgi:hypothetical protein